MTEPLQIPPTDTRGFPADTPVAGMTPEHQAAYWKHYSRQHEDRSRQQAAELAEAQKWKADSEALAKLQAESATDQEKAILAARTETEVRVRAEEQSKMAEVLVRAELKAAAAGRFNSEQLKAFTDNVNPAGFLSATGQPDEAKITAFVNQFAPPAAGGGTPPAGGGASGGGTPPPPAGFTNPLGQGHQEQVPPPGGIAEGAALAKQMFPSVERTKPQ